MHHHIDQNWVGRLGMMRLLNNISSSNWCEKTHYLTPASMNFLQTLCDLKIRHDWNEEIGKILRPIETSDTGIVIFQGENEAILIVPPFPLLEDITIQGPCISPFIDLIDSDPLIGIVLVRLGAYAVGILRGDDLIASKIGSRYVRNQHRAGGSSQRRFERNRERFVREMFQKACGVLQTTFLPYIDKLDSVFLGGNIRTLRNFTNNCRYLQELTHKTQKRILNVNRPNQKTMDSIAFEVWQSRVVMISKELVDGNL